MRDWPHMKKMYSSSPHQRLFTSQKKNHPSVRLHLQGSLGLAAAADPLSSKYARALDEYQVSNLHLASRGAMLCLRNNSGRPDAPMNSCG